MGQEDLIIALNGLKEAIKDHKEDIKQIYDLLRAQNKEIGQIQIELVGQRKDGDSCKRAVEGRLDDLEENNDSQAKEKKNWLKENIVIIGVVISIIIGLFNLSDRIQIKGKPEAVQQKQMGVRN